jgi:homocitrate synthase NifV
MENMDHKVLIIDHTINEVMRLGGHQTAKVQSILSILEKYQVEAIDLAIDNLGENKLLCDTDHMSEIMRCRVGCNEQEIAKAISCGFRKIIITLSVEQPAAQYKRLESVIDQIAKGNIALYLCIDNAMESSLEEIKILYSLALKYKVKRVILGDINSSLESFTTYDKLKLFIDAAQVPVEYMGGNEFGMATANTLAALKAGVKYVAAAVGGIGSPTMAPMEEVLMTVRHLWKNQSIPKGDSLAEDCANILDQAGILLAHEKAIIGKNIFAHESGIHVDGVLKNPELYEVIKPEEFGLTRHLMIGKHSGTAAIIQKFQQFSLNLNKEMAEKLLKEVRDLAVSQKKSVTDAELKNLYYQQLETGQNTEIYLADRGEAAYEIE